MLLQVDATVEYALGRYKQRLTLADLKVRSPYNTYLHMGLPPTPIASPGLASLEAALAAINDLVAAPAVPDVTIDLETMHAWAPMEKLERSGRLADHVIALARRLGFETKDVATGGASDANTTSGMGVPSIDGLGPIGGLDHSPAEYLEVDSIVPRTALFAALLLEVGRDPVVASWRGNEGVAGR